MFKLHIIAIGPCQTGFILHILAVCPSALVCHGKFKLPVMLIFRMWSILWHARIYVNLFHYCSVVHFVFVYLYCLYSTVSVSYVNGYKQVATVLVARDHTAATPCEQYWVYWPCPIHAQVFHPQKVLFPVGDAGPHLIHFCKGSWSKRHTDDRPRYIGNNRLSYATHCNVT